MDDPSHNQTNPTNPSFSQADTQTSVPSQDQHHTPLPATIGHYRIESLIGQGGMGAVYKAQQDSPRRTVALKVIKAGVASKNLLLRFEIEAQILGKLDHPGIATIYEAGTFDEGQGTQPFFAMEFVEGQLLTDYADSKKLGTRDRLALLAKIADAVQHAHQKGVIHRDLKPGNILVNKEGQIKVLDFGVARATDADIQTATMQTDIGQLIGTIPYMSPEQASGNPDDLDTRSDVYALGVIAYELLTGQMPYDLKQKMIHEAVRVIREDEPKTLSAINKTFRGDVEIIVSKALIKEKERRYQSASDLGSDIERYLSNEPIEARPPSTWYQLSKFSKRNKALVAGIIAVLIVSVAGALISINFAMGEAEQKQLALDAAEEARIAQEAAELAQAEEAQRADELQQVANFQSEQLGQIEVETMGIQLRKSIIEGAPEKNQAALSESLASVNFTNIALSTLEANIFERTIEAINTQFEDQPLVQAQLLQSVADTLRELGILEMALSPQQLALLIRRSELSEADINTIISIGNLGNLYLAQGKPELAKPLFQEALDLRRNMFGSGHPETLTALNNVASLLKILGDSEQAKPLFIEALEISRQVHTDDHSTTFRLVNNLGNLLESEGQLEKAERYYREGLSISRRIYGDDHPFTLTSIGNMAALLQAQKKLDEAEILQLEALETTRRILGDRHQSTVIAINNTAALFKSQGKLEEAERYYLEAIDICRNTLGDEHPFTPVIIGSMGQLLKSQGKISQAVPYFQQVLEINQRVHGDNHLNTASSISELALLYELGKNWTEAESLWRQQVHLDRVSESDDSMRLGALLNLLGSNLIEQNRYVDAQVTLEESLDIRKQVMPEGHWRIWNTQSLLGDSLAKQSKFAQAESHLVEAAQQIQPPETLVYRRDEAIQRVIDLYTDWHAAEPNNGYDLKAQEWQSELTPTD